LTPAPAPSGWTTPLWLLFLTIVSIEQRSTGPLVAPPRPVPFWNPKITQRSMNTCSPR
jgi:hypothetical protein